MEVSPFRLSKVGKQEKIDILGEGLRLPHVKKIDSSNQDQTDKLLRGKEIRLALPNPWKARPERRCGWTMRKHLQQQKP